MLTAFINNKEKMTIKNKKQARLQRDIVFIKWILNFDIDNYW